MISNVWFLTILSVIVVSLISFVGAFFLSMNKRLLEKLLLFLVSFAIGALVGDAFLHLLPESLEEGVEPFTFAVYALIGFGVFFFIDKVLRLQHRHVFREHHEHHHHPKPVKPFVWMNLIGDGLHNFIDGLVIGGSYLISVPLGIATTVAVIIHEVAQELGDFAVLIQGGLSRTRALFFNFLSALSSILGGIVALTIGVSASSFHDFLIPFTFAGFVYLAFATLIPELHHENTFSQLGVQGLGILVGVGVMVALLSLG